MSFDTICLSGGGSAGLIQISVLREIKKKIDLNKITKYYGTSVGSMICLFLNLNINPGQILHIFNKFNLINMINITDIEYFIENNALFNKDKFIEFIKKIVKLKSKENLTFSELHNITKKELNIIGFNYSKSKEEIFNYKNTPNMHILKAIEISTAVPLIYKPVFYKNCYYLDGGLANNFPINYCNLDKTIGINLLFYVNTTNMNLDTYIFGILSNILNKMGSNISHKNVLNINCEFKNLGKDNNNQLENYLEIGKKYAKIFLTNLE